MEHTIFLVDMNAFFIACETTRNAALKSRPAAVAGDPKYRAGIILAANYEAREFGVKTTMLINDAKKLCPDIILVPPHHQFYEKKSVEVMKILSRYSPVVQQNSIDEAWMDMDGCGQLFGKPADAAMRIMKDIRGELGLWCSIGISYNKFLAKMASEMKKPHGITEIWENDVPAKIWPLPVRQMYGVGRQTEKKLANMALLSIGDIAACDRSVLANAFGKYGEELHMLAKGVDLSPVTPVPQYDSRSISRSTTLPHDIIDLEEAKEIILRLSEHVGTEARRYGCKGRTVSITIKYSDFMTTARQRSISPPSYLTREIFHTGAKLLEENWNPKRPVRLLGIGLSNMDELAADKPKQISILAADESILTDGREERLERAVDSIREKYGDDKVKRARLLGRDDERR